MKEALDFKNKLVESVFVAADIKKSMYSEQSGRKLNMYIDSFLSNFWAGYAMIFY